jgi:hypothetical protein
MSRRQSRQTIDNDDVGPDRELTLARIPLVVALFLSGAGGSTRALVLRVDATPKRTSSSACIFLIKARLVGGGSQTTCLTQVRGFPGPGATIQSQIVPGTKSKRYPDKDVYLLGPLPATMARRAAAAGLDDALFPYPGTDRLWTESDCRNWREDYFVPIARSHGLGTESDDPYALRHIYATLRIAAHHPTLYIESSMGTGLVGKVYGGVIRRYEGKGPLNIDAEIEAARTAAHAKRGRSRSA